MTATPAAKEARLSSPADEEFGFIPDYDAPIPYMQRIRDYYLTLGYRHALPLGALCRGAVHADDRSRVNEATVALVTTAAPYQPDKGDQGPGAPYNSAAKFYTVYSGDRPRTTTCASRISASTASTRRPRTSTLVPAAGAARGGRARPHRQGRAPLPRRPHQPQPQDDARGRLPGGRRTGQGGRRRRGDLIAGN